MVVLCGRTAYATETAKVEGSLTFTVGGMTYAEGINGHLYVKLWSGTSPIPLSPTVSVPTYTGSCSTAYRDDDWSGPSGWLKLDAIDVSTKGLTSSQSLGSLDPTLPLTHIEFYYNENNGLGVQDVSIQVGDAYYGVPEDWTLVNGGNGWLETDQRCVWWIEIEIARLDGPVGGLPCDGPRDDDSDEDDDEDSDVVALVVSLCVVGAFLVFCGIIYAKKYYSSKSAKVAAVPNNAAADDDGDTITVEAPPGKLGLKFDGTSTRVKEVFSDSPWWERYTLVML